jgi:hypothetical protein
MKKAFLKKRRIFWVAITMLIFILMLRIALPYAILWYIDKQANKMPDYQLQVEDLAVHLYRGSYTLKNLRLLKLDKHIPTPFLQVKTIDLAVEWGALLHGAFVAQITADEPVVNFVVDPKGDNEQLAISKEWQSLVKALFPLNFNKMTVNNGSLHYRSFTASPPFDIYLKNIQAEINNLQKVENPQIALSSRFTLTANTLDGGPVTLKIQFDPFAKQPSFNLLAELKQLRIATINSFLRHYTKITVSDGWFSLYVEAVAEKGKVQGYAKPFLKDLKVINSKEDLNPIEALYKGAVAVVAKILENPSQKTIATRIPIQGSIDSPDTSIWSIIGNLLSHAFLQALLPKIDHNIKFGEAS